MYVLTTNSNLQETQRLMAEPVPGISAVPDEQNARYFHVVVAGSLTFSVLTKCHLPFKLIDCNY